MSAADRRARAAARDAGYEIKVIGETPTPLRDLYHLVMQLAWPSTIAVVAGGYLLANALFACVYLATGGIAHAHTRSFADAFFFSVQTMGTIGFGSMFPDSMLANAVVVVESTFSLLFTALATGLVFAKFSRPSARVMFSRTMSLAPMDGAPTLSFRVGNQRKNRIVEAEVRLAMVRTEVTAEGKTFYRMHDLKLTRPRILSLSRSWNVLHKIDRDSPLFGTTPESLAAEEAEVIVSLSGTDDTWMQTVHASHTYTAKDIAWGHRHADVLDDQGATVVLDLRRFHDTEPIEPSADFPYPRRARESS